MEDEQDDLFEQEQALAESEEQEQQDEEQDEQSQETEDGEGEQQDGEGEGEDDLAADEVYSVTLPDEDGGEEVVDVNVSDLPTILGNARAMYNEVQTLRSQVSELSKLRDLGQYVAGQPLLAQLLQYKLQGGSDKEILERTYLYMQENNLFNEEGQQADGQQLDPQIGQMKSELEQLRNEREAERQQALLNSNYQSMAAVFSDMGYEASDDPATMQKIGKLFNQVAGEVIADIYGKEAVNGFLSKRQVPKAVARQIWEEAAARNPQLVRKAGATSNTRSSAKQVQKATSNRAVTNPPVRMTGGNRGVATASQNPSTRSANSSSKGSTDRERAAAYRKLGL